MRRQSLVMTRVVVVVFFVGCRTAENGIPISSTNVGMTTQAVLRIEGDRVRYDGRRVERAQVKSLLEAAARTAGEVYFPQSRMTASRLFVLLSFPAEMRMGEVFGWLEICRNAGVYRTQLLVTSEGRDAELDVFLAVPNLHTSLESSVAIGVRGDDESVKYRIGQSTFTSLTDVATWFHRQQWASLEETFYYRYVSVYADVAVPYREVVRLLDTVHGLHVGPLFFAAPMFMAESRR